MSQSLSELRDTTREEIKVDPKGLVWSDSVLDRYITISHKKIQKDLQWKLPGNEQRPASEVSTDGVNLEFDLSSFAIGKIGLVKWTDGKSSGVLRFTTKKELLRSSNLDTVANPSKYYLRGTYIGFDAIPSSGLTIEIYPDIVVAAPTEDEESDLPDTDEVNTAIALYAKFLAWRSAKGQKAEADAALEEYKEVRDDLRYEYWVEIDDMQFDTQRDVNLNSRGSSNSINW